MADEVKRYRTVVDGSPFPRLASDPNGEICMSADVANLQIALTSAQAEVLSLKSRNEDLRLENQTLVHDKEALDKRIYEQGLKLQTADGLLMEYRATRHSPGNGICEDCSNLKFGCTKDHRCDLCKRTDTHLDPSSDTRRDT